MRLFDNDDILWWFCVWENETVWNEWQEMRMENARWSLLFEFIGLDHLEYRRNIKRYQGCGWTGPGRLNGGDWIGSFMENLCLPKV